MRHVYLWVALVLVFVCGAIVGAVVAYQAGCGLA